MLYKFAKKTIRVVIWYYNLQKRQRGWGKEVHQYFDALYECELFSIFLISPPTNKMIKILDLLLVRFKMEIISDATGAVPRGT